MLELSVVQVYPIPVLNDTCTQYNVCLVSFLNTSEWGNSKIKYGRYHYFSCSEKFNQNSKKKEEDILYFRYVMREI